MSAHCFISTLHTENIIPVAFHPYTSVIPGDKRFVSIECEGQEMTEGYKETQRLLVALFKDQGMRAYEDNKTVFECRLWGHTVCYGFYDWTFSVGSECIERR